MRICTVASHLAAVAFLATGCSPSPEAQTPASSAAEASTSSATAEEQPASSPQDSASSTPEEEGAPAADQTTCFQVDDPSSFAINTLVAFEQADPEFDLTNGEGEPTYVEASFDSPVTLVDDYYGAEGGTWTYEVSPPEPISNADVPESVTYGSEAFDMSQTAELLAACALYSFDVEVSYTLAEQAEDCSEDITFSRGEHFSAAHFTVDPRDDGLICPDPSPGEVTSYTVVATLDDAADGDPTVILSSVAAGKSIVFH